MPNKISKEYVAGWFDGEGCIFSYAKKRAKDGYTLSKIVVSQTYPYILEIMKEQYGGNIHLSKSINSCHKDKYQCRLETCEDVWIFLNDIMPFLHEKQPQAIIALTGLVGEIPRKQVSEYLKESKQEVYHRQ